MGHDLNCLAKEGAFAFLCDYSPIYPAGSDVIGLRQMHAKKSLVMAKVQIGLCAIVRDIALAMFVRIQCSWIHIDVRIEFLNCDSETSGLKKLCQRCGYYSFSKG